MALLAASHAVDDMYQGAVPALLPFFIAGRHYGYAAATGLTFAATASSPVIQSASTAQPALSGPGGPDGYRDQHRAVRPGGQLPPDLAGHRAIGNRVTAFPPEAVQAAPATSGA